MSCEVLNIGISDHHSITLAATRLHAPPKAKKEITYRSYKHFSEANFIQDLEKTPFHVAHIFEDVDDQMWFHNKLFEEVVTSGELRKPINVKAMLKRKKIPTKGK